VSDEVKKPVRVVRPQPRQPKGEAAKAVVHVPPPEPSTLPVQEESKPPAEPKKPPMTIETARKCATKAVELIGEAQAKLKLYGADAEGNPLIPASAKFVLRCAFCDKLIQFAPEEPFNPKGLTPLTCKGCWKQQPFGPLKQKFGAECVRTISEDIAKYLAKQKA
jgi:hypothetical protein